MTSSVTGVSFSGQMQMLCSSLKQLQDVSAVAMLSCLVLHVTAALALQLYCRAMTGSVSIQQTVTQPTKP